MAWEWFREAACQAGLRPLGGGRGGARIHGLRHCFAVGTLLNWYRRDADVDAHLPELATFLGHEHVTDTYWYLSAVAGASSLGDPPLGASRERTKMKTFSELLQAYFTERLMKECNASPHTIANYRDTFRLLIAFAQQRLKKPPTKLAIQDLDATFVLAFLEYLEKDRGNSTRSRNVRLSAIHSFFAYAALQEPAIGAVAQRILAIQSKRCAKRPMDFLSRAESDALLGAPDQNTRSGRRDRTLLLVALQTGLRISELIGLRCQGCGVGDRRSCALHRQGAQNALFHCAKRSSSLCAIGSGSEKASRPTLYSRTPVAELSAGTVSNTSCRSM